MFSIQISPVPLFTMSSCGYFSRHPLTLHVSWFSYRGLVLLFTSLINHVPSAKAQTPYTVRARLNSLYGLMDDLFIKINNIIDVGYVSSKINILYLIQVKQYIKNKKKEDRARLSRKLPNMLFLFVLFWGNKHYLVLAVIRSSQWEQ